MKKKILSVEGSGHLSRRGAVAGETLLRGRLTGRLLVRLDPKAELGLVLKGLKGFVLPRLRVALVEEGSAAEVRKLAAVKGSAFLAVEEERRLHKLGGDKPLVDSRVASWGKQALNVMRSA
jgi:hypothetical protein